MRTLLVSIALVVLSACGGGFAPADRIERTRVVAARSHAAGDPTRAWVLPGEHATVEYLIVGSGMMTEPLHTSFLACTPASMAGPNGITGCDGPTFDAASADVAASYSPVLDHGFDAPAHLAASFTTSVLTYLGTCVGDGASSVDVAVPSATCTGSARSELYRFGVHVVPDARLANHNPNIHDERFYLGDVLWATPRPSVPATGCAALAPSPALPTVRMSGHDSPLLIFGCSPDDREMYPAFDADGHVIVAQEHIDISHFVTLGTMSSSTRIDDDTPGLIASTHWNRPAFNDLTVAQNAALSSGLLVRFWFVARDGRGGADWLERDLCLVR